MANSERGDSKIFDDADVKDKLQKFVSLHSSIKGMILYTEEISNRSNAQELLEIRDATDHLVRVLRVELENKSNSDYEVQNLDKAIGHLCRAGYDVLDWTSLILRQKMETELKGFSTDTITAVLPNYYSEIKPKVLKISTKIAKIREEKDIGKLTLEEFTEYFEQVEQLKQYYSEIIDKKSSLIEVQRKNRWKNWIIPIVTGTIVAVIAYLLGYLKL